MANSKKYDIELRTTSTDAVPEALQGTRYWYDVGTQVNGEKVYYDNATDAYAYWNDGADWLLTAVADVDGTPTDYFEDDGTGTLTGNGSWSGTITASEYTIADAWYRAETAAFESLENFSGCEEGQSCFRGFLPVAGDSDAYDLVNVWQMTSGATDFDVSRTFGEDALWCSLQNGVRIESLWESRQRAMEFVGLVMAWLKETNNLKETGNVTWCTLSDTPAEPEIYRTDGENRQRYWRQEIGLELTYKTETVYS